MGKLTHCVNYFERKLRIFGIISRLPEETDVAAFDDESASVIRLNNSTVLYMREINKVLALVCILREENFTKPGMIDFNFLVLRECVDRVFIVRNQSLQMKQDLAAIEDQSEMAVASLPKSSSVAVS